MTGDSTPSLLVSMGLVEAIGGRQPSWLVRAISAIAMMWPLVALSRLCLIFALGSGWSRLWTGGLHPLGHALAAGLCLADLAILVVPRLRLFRCLSPHAQMRWLLPLLFASGLLYTLVAQFALGRDSAHAVLFSILMPALVAVGISGGQRMFGFAYCLGTLLPFLPHPPQAFGFASPAAALLGLLLAAVVQARHDQAHLIKRQSNMMRSEQALALLTEFEDAGRGWFWETDHNGDLSYVSATLAHRFGTEPEEMIGRPITSLMRQDGGDANTQEQRTIGFHLSARTAFSEIAVRAALPGEECWWSLSGRPIINEFGRFLGFRGSGSDLTEMRKSQAEVARLARYDSLTGLANRPQMLATLEQSVADVSGRPAECALFILDLDRFKVVNDTMGHPAGDALLRQVSQRLTRAVGEAGRVGRLGGDEFQVILPGEVDRAHLAKLAELIIHSVSQPYVIEGAQVVIGVSIGIAVAPHDGASADTLTRNADLALYKAKDSGRGAFRFYSQDMHADAEDRRQLEQELRHAIGSGGLHVEYQPVVSSSTERITGFEALVRWRHPVRGSISPVDFIPIAEEAGLIGQIGDWVLRVACQDAAGWPDGIRVAVNVSPTQFSNPGFPTLVMQALAKSGLEPARLELEITESVFLGGNDTDAMFARLKGIGVRLALDDFGTGYSALGYLKTAPFDKIKIDQSFVRGAAIKGSRNGAIVQSIVSLAEALSMETTAEGAETLDELELIRSLGCSHVQGYIYGRPETNEAVHRRFASGDPHIRPNGPRTSREARKAMLRSVKLVHGSHSYDGRIRNISSGGALVEGLADVPSGTAFRVYFSRTYSVEAICRWSSEDRMGLEFAQPVRLDLARGFEEQRGPQTIDVGEAPQRRRAG